MGLELWYSFGMEIKSKLTNKSGQELDVIYYENLDPNQNLEGKMLQAV